MSLLMSASGSAVILSFASPNDQVSSYINFDTVNGEPQPRVFGAADNDGYIGSRPNPSPGGGGKVSVTQTSISGGFYGTLFWDDRAVFNIVNKEADRYGTIIITGTESGLPYTATFTSLDTQDSGGRPQYTFTITRPNNVVASSGSNNYANEDPIKRTRGF